MFHIKLISLIPLVILMYIIWSWDYPLLWYRYNSDLSHQQSLSDSRLCSCHLEIRYLISTQHNTWISNVRKIYTLFKFPLNTNLISKSYIIKSQQHKRSQIIKHNFKCKHHKVGRKQRFNTALCTHLKNWRCSL